MGPRGVVARLAGERSSAARTVMGTRGPMRSDSCPANPDPRCMMIVIGSRAVPSASTPNRAAIWSWTTSRKNSTPEGGVDLHGHHVGGAELAGREQVQRQHRIRPWRSTRTKATSAGDADVPPTMTPVSTPSPAPMRA